MKVAVKTLTGSKFEIEAELSTTIAECKKIVEADKGFPAAGMKLICDGKVLKDDVTLEAAGIKPGSFLVCFVSKKAKAKKPAPAPTPAPQPVTMTGDGTGSSSSNTESTSTTAPAPTTATTAPSSNESTSTENAQPTSGETSRTSSNATGAQQSNTDAPATTAPQPTVDSAVVQQVMEITNTDEATATAAVRAAFGDVSRAVAYVFDPSSMPQVAPPQQHQAQQGDAGNAQTAGADANVEDALNQLRNDPRFDQLRTMVQQNPASLPAVLRGIETSNPQLFAIINQNTEAFVRMLNEPVQASSNAQATTAAPQQQQQQPTPTGAPGAGLGGLPQAGGMMPGGMNPAQLVQMMNALPPQARAQMAQQLGMTPEQLTQFQQMVSSMPPGQLQQMMQQMGGGGAPGQGGLPPGAVRVNLSQEDQAAIQRLESMGLGSRNEIIQVYLACDRNENQAANILMDQAFQ